MGSLGGFPAAGWVVHWKVQDTSIDMAGASVVMAGGLGSVQLHSSGLSQASLSLWCLQQNHWTSHMAAQGSGSECHKKGKVEPANLLRPELRRRDITTFPIFYLVKTVAEPIPFKIMLFHLYLKAEDINPSL